MNHYEMLDKDQKLQWKNLIKIAEGMETGGTEIATRQPTSQTFGPTDFDHFQNRNAKIEAYKRKKQIETLLDQLRDYKDEDMKRDFFMNSLKYSIIKSMEQIQLM